MTNKHDNKHVNEGVVLKREVRRHGNEVNKDSHENGHMMTKKASRAPSSGASTNEVDEDEESAICR